MAAAPRQPPFLSQNKLPPWLGTMLARESRFDKPRGAAPHHVGIAPPDDPHA